MSVFRSADQRCPACGAGALEQVYTLQGIPAQSAILLDSADAAASYPVGDLDLTWCAVCGLAFNIRYDVRKVHYGDGYEESQGASAIFRRYAQGLSERWINQYGLRGKRALEIGCGKGEFLELYCDLSGGSGVGFDPVWDPERQNANRAGKVSFHREQFDERHIPFDADLIICRHTLEHVKGVREFVRLLRATCGGNTAAIVAIEVPDLKRILVETAFWDVYYEHASYFTAGALARLFDREDFEVLSLQRVYGEQYLVLEARPAGRTPTVLPAIADDLDETRTAVAKFRDSATTAIASWRRRFEQWHRAGDKVVLWGSGSKAVGFLTGIGVSHEVCGIVDINPRRDGLFMPGVPIAIIGPGNLPAVAPDRVVIMNAIYKDEIEAELGALGLSPSLHTTADRFEA